MFRPCWSVRDLSVCTTVSLVVAMSCPGLVLSAEEPEGLKFTVRCLMVTPNDGALWRTSTTTASWTSPWPASQART